MLGPGRYLLGAVEVLLWAGLAGAAGWRLRTWLVPRLRGTAAALATTLIAVAILIWCAELLGSFGVWEPVPYLVLVGMVAAGAWLWAPLPDRPARVGPSYSRLVVALALLVALVATIHFGGGVKDKLGTGMTGFDSTWYHGPFAAGFFQSGDTWNLHFIAPQFLAWFYPANSEVLHAAGMLAFGRDLLSPLLNLGWFVGCLVACWAIGRPYRVAPWSLALGAVALSVPALSDQAGEARNDLVGIFFLLAAVAVALNAWGDERPRLDLGALAVVGLGAGLAAGTKLNFILPAAVLVIGLVVLAPRGRRWRALAAAGLAALAGCGYWYLRNVVHSGNPLPWIHHLGPISLPAPAQALGGREAHSVLGYLTDGSVWSDWFLPGLHHGLWIVWPLLALGAVAGLLLALVPLARRVWLSFVNQGMTKDNHTAAGLTKDNHAGAAGVLAVAGLVGLASALAWLVAPTSASGPDGMPRGFESGLRYLAPALVLGLALLPAAPPFRKRLASLATAPWLSFVNQGMTKDNHTAAGLTKDNHAGRRLGVAALALGLVAVVAAGYAVQRHYLASRYKNPSFTTPGLNAAFAWARGVSGARIATTSTRQYPLFGTDLSNRVQYLGERTAHGGFEAPPSCRAFVRLLNAGDYDYLVASRDRIEPGKPPFPPQARWAERGGAEVVLRKPPTVVFRLHGPLGPAACS
ncbi:MAG: hypothetical protein JST31_01970 [Actinobacteria bacterium]|nr:hypothetical protein [Actinomycetota bacterium]